MACTGRFVLSTAFFAFFKSITFIELRSWHKFMSHVRCNQATNRELSDKTSLLSTFSSQHYSRARTKLFWAMCTIEARTDRHQPSFHGKAYYLVTISGYGRCSFNHNSHCEFTNFVEFFVLHGHHGCYCIYHDMNIHSSTVPAWLKNNQMIHWITYKQEYVLQMLTKLSVHSATHVKPWRVG